MPRKTLMDYSGPEQKRQQGPDRHIISFLKAQKPGDILFIGSAMCAYLAHQKGFKVTVVDRDLQAIKEGRAGFPGVRHEYADFMSFSRRTPRDSYDIIIDKGYCNTLRRDRSRMFFSELAKLLRFNGKLFLKCLATSDSYCREHCPKRHWTYTEGAYVNFFTKRSLCRLVQGYMGIDSCRVMRYPDDGRTYHLVTAELKVMKLRT